MTTTNKQIADVARRYVVSWRQLAECTEGGLMFALVERDAAFHALVGALGERCPMCEQGTCPYIEDIDAAAEWLAEPSTASDVADPRGLLNEPEAS